MDLKFWIILECVEALVLSQKHSFELSYKCCVKKSHTFNVGSWINLRECSCTLNFYCYKTQYFWCSLIIWGFYSRVEALNLELGGDNACVKPFAVEFHCWIADRIEALWIGGVPSFFFLFFFLTQEMFKPVKRKTQYNFLAWGQIS